MSSTFSKGEKLISWATTPSFLFASLKSSSISISKIFTLPDVLVTREEIIPIVDDLPAPFGPSKAKKSPFFTSRSIPSSALTPDAYFFSKDEIFNARSDIYTSATLS